MKSEILCSRNDADVMSSGETILIKLIISIRPQQWYKNLILFISIIFSLNILNLGMWFKVILAFVIFCMLSGSEYLFNDIIDRERDRNHPTKHKRPIASGELKLIPALLFGVVMIIGAGSLSYLINMRFLAISIIYLLLIMIYSLALKEIIIVDLLVISIGFVIRAIAGAIAINVLISPWLIICTFLLALFLALGKRRHEIILLGIEAKNHRKTLEEYSAEILDQMLSITTGALIVSYSMYTFLTNNYYMMITIPIVVYSIFRYVFLIHKKDLGGEPEMLFKDEGMLISMFLWGILVIGALYATDLAMKI